MKSTFNRRHLLATATLSSIGLTFPRLLPADEKNIKVKTFTYKTVGNLKIKADVHRADDDVKRPVIVWIHGGALIMGHRAGISRRVKDMAIKAGYALVSIDYRLAPETKLPGIIEDLEDAFTWIHKEGPRLFNIDTSRIAVMGGSAGGCLTLVSGFRAKPRPTVLVSFWGYGDLIGDWYSKPSPHKRHNAMKVTREQALKQVSGPPISDSRDRKGNGSLFYLHCRQQGIWPKEVTGWDPKSQPEKFYPYMAVRNVTPDYPPTLLIHGTKDTDVPYEQSVMMAKQFEKHKVAHRLISIPGGEHGLGGGDPKLINDAYDAVMPFVNQKMELEDFFK